MAKLNSAEKQPAKDTSALRTFAFLMRNLEHGAKKPQQGCRGAWAALLKGHFIVRDDTVVLSGAALESVEARWEQGSCHRLVLQQHTSALGFDGLDDSHFAIRYRVCGDEFAHGCGSVFKGEAGDRSIVSLHEKIG